MAKDPAMLWYWSDWYSGTVLMSRFLKGCYMDLLHAQFNSGRLSLEEIKTCLGPDFGQSWLTLQKKFKQDQSGLFFNERLELEKEKRAAFTRSRKKNLENKPHMEPHMDHHMGSHMDNVNVIGIKDEFNEGVQGEKFLIPEMSRIFKKANPNYPEGTERDYKPLLSIANFISTQLHCTGPPEKNAEKILDQWEIFAGFIAQDDFYNQKSLITISNHIQEIYQKNKNGTDRRTSTKLRTGKDSGKYELLKKFKEDFSGR